MTAQLGSIYDVPLTQSQDEKSSAAASTAAGSSVRFSDTQGDFG